MTQLVLEEPVYSPVILRYDAHTDTAFTNHIWMQLCGDWLRKETNHKQGVIAELGLWCRYADELSKLTFQES